MTALAVWPDGNYETLPSTLHDEIAEQEDTQGGSTFFERLIERALEPSAVELVVSDGTICWLACTRHRYDQKERRLLRTPTTRWYQAFSIIVTGIMGKGGKFQGASA